MLAVLALVGFVAFILFCGTRLRPYYARVVDAQRKQQMKHAMYKGQRDGRLFVEAVDEMQRDGW